MGDVFTDKVLAAVHGGRTIEIFYKIDLRRTTARWFDRTLETAIVTVTVRYDPITHTYHVTRLFDSELQRMEATRREEFVRERLVADFEALPLFKTVTLQPGTDYHIRARAVPSSWWIQADTVRASFRLR
jgi:hypothetical protein